MCGGGSAPSGITRYDWNESIAPYWNGPEAGVLERSRQLRDRPHEQYPYQQLAGLDPRHHTAAASIDHFVGSGGSPATIAANGQAQQTLDGHYLTGDGANPYASQANQYAGVDSPYFRDLMSMGLEDIGTAYRDATLPGINSEAVRAGVFGGGDHDRNVGRSEQQLAREMSRHVAGMSNDQYNRSAGMEEGRLGRATGAFEGERGRQMGAIGAGQAEQGLFFDRMRNLMGMGDMFRSDEQDQLNLAFQNWQEAQNWDQSQMDWFTNILSRAQGGVSPTSVSTHPGFSASPFSALLGAGMLGYGAFG